MEYSLGGLHATDRRGLLRLALLLAGAGMASSASASIVLLEEGDTRPLSPTLQAVLAASADLMVPRTDTPGALDVGVPALFEGLLAQWASPATRALLVGALEVIEGLAGDGRSFAALDAEQQMALLLAHDTQALSLADGPRQNPFGPPPVADPAYQRFKQLVLTLYYYSRPALTEELGYVHVPGPWRPSVPINAATRPMGGPGMF